MKNKAHQNCAKKLKNLFSEGRRGLSGQFLGQFCKATSRAQFCHQKTDEIRRYIPKNNPNKFQRDNSPYDLLLNIHRIYINCLLPEPKLMPQSLYSGVFESTSFFGCQRLSDLKFVTILILGESLDPQG